MADGEVVVVAGASGGIGRAIVTECLRRGRSVVGVVHRPSSGLSSPVPEFVADVTDPSALSTVVDRIAREAGPIAGLVNTVAVQDTGRLAELTQADWDTMMAANLTGAHHLTQAVARTMVTSSSGGSVVHVASIEGHRPAPGHGHYAASKAGLISYVKSAAAELGPHGVRVNSVSPGLCHRPGIEQDWPDGVGRWLATAPLGRLVEPADVARACWFLLSEESSAITGVDLVVDTGVTATAGW